MSDLEALVASYLDLQPEGEAEAEAVLAMADAGAEAWSQARLAALRSIAHAAEDLELEAFADEVDRTMLLDTLRFDMHELRHTLTPMDATARLDGWLAALADEPIGVRGTLRQLAARREAVAAQVMLAADALGASSGFAARQMIRAEAADADWSPQDPWPAEWARVGAVLASLGLPVVSGEAPPLAETAVEAPGLTSLAVRAQAMRSFEAARHAQSRSARQRLRAPGLLSGWARTVGVVLADSALFDQPERALMHWWRVLEDAVTAELELAHAAGLLTEAEVLAAAEAHLGVDEAPAVVRRVLAATGESVAAALAHAQWLHWWEEAARDGMPTATWMGQALATGGLSVRLARWAAQQG